ncbi:MAG: hypothetical protein HYX21_00360 [Candidatus Yanofskybacteria bacterium]|nr:hypothetical protein [Candidatus Yanofskybacteria bacterium]
MTSLDKNIKKVVVSLVKSLSERNRDIVLRRFGLKTGSRETLESIGQSYGITRERVRQIEEYALKNLRTESSGSMVSAVKPYFDFVKELLVNHGGFLSESDLYKKFSGQNKDNVANLSFAFLLALNSDFARNYENDNFNTFWSLNDSSLDSAAKLVGSVEAALKEKNSLLTKDELYSLYKTKTKSKLISMDAFLTAAAVSKNIDKNIFGQYGLVSWSEVKPRGVRDRAFMVLKREAKPKHFREITSLINTAQFAVKKANVQTVHNELIKDSRFVLVGRGIYGLSEWGYKSGTVKDVLVDILKESKKPLDKNTLVAKVLSSRYVKENTVVLNLQDSKIFAKKQDGTYSLKEA